MKRLFVLTTLLLCTLLSFSQGLYVPDPAYGKIFNRGIFTRTLQIPAGDTISDTYRPADGEVILRTTGGDSTLYIKRFGRFNKISGGPSVAQQKYRIDTAISTVDDLGLFSGANGDAIIVTDPDRGGLFVWSSFGTVDNGIGFGALTGGLWKRIDINGKVNIKWYGATSNGVDDDVTAIRGAIAAGQNVFIPSGTFGVNQTVTLSGYTHIIGEDLTARIQTALDIPIFDTDTLPGSFNQDIVLESLQLTNTLAPTAGLGTTKYHVVITDGLYCEIKSCWFRTTHANTDYHINNRGGVAFVKSGVGAFAYVNWIDRCIFENSAINMGTGDSKITKSYVWGHTLGVPGIQLVGNVSIQDCDIIPSFIHGGIGLTNTSDNSSIVNCYFDGSTSPVATGYGIIGNAARNITITGNRFWHSQKGGIQLTDCNSFTITANSFRDNNRSDNSWSDIRVEGVAVSPQNIIASNNTFNQTATLTNMGRAVQEVGTTFMPYDNNYANNTIRGNYVNPSIVILTDSSHTWGSRGVGAPSKARESTINGGNTATLVQLKIADDASGSWRFTNAGAPTSRQLFQGFTSSSAVTPTISFDPSNGGFLSGAFGLGTTVIPTSAKLYVTSSTLPQFRTEFSTGNRMDVTTASTGSTTFALTGTTPAFTFSNLMNINAGAGVSAIQQRIGTGATTARWEFVNSGVATDRLQLRAFNSSNTEMINIDPSGPVYFNNVSNFGIGIPVGTPLTQKFMVSGSGSFTGSLTSTGLITGGAAFSRRTVTGAYTIIDSDLTVTVNNTSGGVIISLPSATGTSGKVFIVKKISPALNDVTLEPDGAELIDGVANRVLTLQFSAMVLQSNGTGWDILAAYAQSDVL